MIVVWMFKKSSKLKRFKIFKKKMKKKMSFGLGVLSIFFVAMFITFL
jgi:hypothetical protein